MDRLEKNFLWLSAGNVLAAAFNVTIFIYLARALGAEAFGYLSYATTLVLYLFNFMDPGLSTYGTRETAKDHARFPEFVSNIVSFKFILTLAILAIFLLFVWAAPQALLMKVLLTEASLLLVVLSFATEWAFQGLEKMHMVFISLVLSAFLQLCMVLFFIKGPGDLLKAPLISAAAPVPIIAIFLFLARFRLRIRTLDFRVIRVYLSSSLVIWAISVFAQVYNSLDIVLLGLFRSAEEVGYFTIARRVVSGAALVILVLASAVMPHLSAAFVRDRARFDRASLKFLKIGIFVILAVFIPIMIFSKPLIAMTVGGQYINAAPAMRIMMGALILVMVNVPFSTGLIAAGFERSVLRQAFASAAISIVSNFILMPKYGMIGASVSFVLAEALALTWILWLYKVKIRKG